MATEHSERKTLRIDDSLTYSYIYHEAKKDCPTFLLVHGFPSSAYDWRKQIADLRQSGYGVLAPDLLGYGETDKPDAVEEYKFSKMTAHISKIIEREQLTQVIGVGHDWGSVMLSRLWNYYPQYFSSLVFLAVPYQPPGPFDLDAVNAMTEQAFGYPVFGYWKFFDEADAADVLARHHTSATSIIYQSDMDLWKTELCPVGKFKEWVTAGRTMALPAWLTAEERDVHDKILLEGGYTGPLNWYKAVIRGIHGDDDSQIPPERFVVSVPAVFVPGELDAISRPELALRAAEQGRQGGYLTDVEVKIMPGTGHWLPLEKPDEIREILEEMVRKL
ncbi:Alpha/Beta hydrolase protein [Massariosphaeria phaeospora]|uniref:Alpha/Beta hydrolase protein n=1 Tax=Massariosphaeria phaeospora TaxID=100035 RepID=A0A7C8IBA7_9PLEO|nr:Alpha/Beta hydrolase protein [Massariosphaeria phaeospora]